MPVILLSGSVEALTFPIPDDYDAHRHEALPPLDELPPVAAAIILCDANDEVLNFINQLTKRQPTCFTIVFSHDAATDAMQRYNAFRWGSRMVTECKAQLLECLEFISEQATERGTLRCPICGLTQLTPSTLWCHSAMYHANTKSSSAPCPICNMVPDQSLQVHIHDKHPPDGAPEPPREPLPLYAFGLVVVRRLTDGKFLLVQEFASKGYWLPGGHMEAGEDPATAAVRETKEEAGVDVELKGILRVEFSICNKWQSPYGRLRLIYYAEPVDPNQLPKSLPDFESCGAVYVTADEVKHLPLRSSEPLQWIPYVAKGGTIHPLTVFTPEMAPIVGPSVATA